MRRHKAISSVKENVSLLRTSVKHQTREFFDNSTLHGIRYIAEEDRSFSEKFMWFSFVAIGAVAAFVIIGSLWEKFQTNPTITGLDTDFHNIEVPFPSVTVCPDIAYNEEVLNQTAFNFLDEGSSEGIDQIIGFLKSLPIMSYDRMEQVFDALQNVSNPDKFNDRDLRALIFEIGIKCNDLFSMCYFKGEEVACCDYFYPLYNEQGFCYAFNPRYHSSIEQEVQHETFSELYETDDKWALYFTVPSRARVFLHSISEITSHDYRPTIIWEPKFKIDLLVTMKQTYTTEDAETLSIKQRKCIFDHEVEVTYYKKDIYTFTSCMRECRVKRSNKFCKCIAPYYKPQRNTYRQCDVADIPCLTKYRKNITDIRYCRHCELNCLNTVYDIEKYTRLPESDQFKIEERTNINIEFLTWPIIRYKREVLFGWTDLLVSFGGIAGLFLGFSILSGVEIIYYFTMRSFCMVHMSRAELYEMREEDKKREFVEYDMGWKPKFKKSDRMKKSVSLPNIITVRPVESSGSSGSSKAIEVKAFDSPKAPIKKKQLEQQQIFAISKMEIHNRLQKLDAKTFGLRKLDPSRRNIFAKLQVAPYNRNIKPLDKKFRLRSHSEGPDKVMFDGYLP